MWVFTLFVAVCVAYENTRRRQRFLSQQLTCVSQTLDWGIDFGPGNLFYMHKIQFLLLLKAKYFNFSKIKKYIELILFKNTTGNL